MEKRKKFGLGFGKTVKRLKGIDKVVMAMVDV